MSVLLSEDKTEILLTCSCGCEDSIHIKLDPFDEDPECDDVAIWTYMQNCRDASQVSLKEKCKKIWRIIRDKDYWYSDVCLKKTDIEILVKYFQDMLQKS